MENPDDLMRSTDETQPILSRTVARRGALLGSLALLALGACRHNPPPIIKHGDGGEESAPWWLPLGYPSHASARAAMATMKVVPAVAAETAAAVVTATTAAAASD